MLRILLFKQNPMKRYIMILLQTHVLGSSTKETTHLNIIYKPINLHILFRDLKIP